VERKKVLIPRSVLKVCTLGWRMGRGLQNGRQRGRREGERSEEQCIREPHTVRS
jgi:hypothetical protein